MLRKSHLIHWSIVLATLASATRANAGRPGKDFDSVYDDIYNMQNRLEEARDGFGLLIAALTDQERAGLAISAGVRGLGKDSDGDLLPDLLERNSGICDSDSDNDGLVDGAEIGIVGPISQGDSGSDGSDSEMPTPQPPPPHVPYGIYREFPFYGELRDDCGLLYRSDVNPYPNQKARSIGVSIGDNKWIYGLTYPSTRVACRNQVVDRDKILLGDQPIHGCITTFHGTGRNAGKPSITLGINATDGCDAPAELQVAQLKNRSRIKRAFLKLVKLQRRLSRRFLSLPPEQRNAVAFSSPHLGGLDSDGDGLADIFEKQDTLCDPDSDNDGVPDGIDFGFPNKPDPTIIGDSPPPAQFPHSVYPNYPSAGKWTHLNGRLRFGHVDPLPGQAADEIIVTDINGLTDSVKAVTGGAFHCNTKQVDYADVVRPDLANDSEGRILAYREGDGPQIVIFLWVDALRGECPHDSRRQ
jgi:hypothetical protein